MLWVTEPLNLLYRRKNVVTVLYPPLPGRSYASTDIKKAKLEPDMTPTIKAKVQCCNSFRTLGPIYMSDNTSPARPGADKRSKFQALFIWDFMPGLKGEVNP